MVTLHFGTNRPDAKVPQSQLDACWLRTMLTGFPVSYLGIAAFAESDVTDDMKTIDAPTLIVHGDADQIAPGAQRRTRARLDPEDLSRRLHAMTTTHSRRGPSIGVPAG